jgi:small conductance mechanosensitive channel
VSGNSASAQEVPVTNPEAFQKQVDQLERTVKRVTDINAELNDQSVWDREALIYRRDELTIKALVGMDSVARALPGLDPESELRQQWEEKLRTGLMGVEDMLFRRLDELNERIAANEQRAQEASGSLKIAEEAYANSLRNLRLDYYGSMVSVIESRKQMDLPVGNVEEQIEQILFRHAERTVAKLELIDTALKDVSRRAAGDSGNADIASAAVSFKLARDFHLDALKSLVELLNRLEFDTSVYRATILRSSNVISAGLFDRVAVAQILDEVWVELRDALVENAPDLVIQLMIFLLILIAFRALSRAVRRLVEAALDRSASDMSTLLHDVLISLSGGTVMLFGILVALSQVGISLGPMLAGLGVAGFIVGFALQDTLGNFASGGMILIYRPYDVDDYVEVAGAAGLVKKMTLVSTTILTIDNQTLVIPNSKIWGDVIKNVTHQRVRRVDMEFGIGYGDDIEKAERVLRDVVEQHEKTLPKPEPIIVVNSLGDSSVNFAVRPWVKTEDYWSVYWDITREVKLRFDREGISIPFPQRDVHFYNEGA